MQKTALVSPVCVIKSHPWCLPQFPIVSAEDECVHLTHNKHGSGTKEQGGSHARAASLQEGTAGWMKRAGARFCFALAWGAAGSEGTGRAGAVGDGCAGAARGLGSARQCREPAPGRRVAATRQGHAAVAGVGTGSQAFACWSPSHAATELMSSATSAPSRAATAGAGAAGLGSAETRPAARTVTRCPACLM